MERDELDSLECEANGHTPTHILSQVQERVEKITYADQVDELFRDNEGGQYYGARYPGYRKITTTR